MLRKFTASVAFGLLVLSCGQRSVAPRAPSPPPSQPHQQAGDGFFLTEAPVADRIALNASGKRAKPKVTSDFDQLPTSAQWWSSLMWQYEDDQPHGLTLHAHPLVVRADSRGLGVGYPDRPEVAPRHFMHRYAEDLHLGLEGLDAPETRVAGYSDWAVTADWNDALRVTVGHGMPFLYAERRSQAPVVVRWTDKANVFFQDGATVGVSINGHHYGLFAPLGSEWSRSSDGLRSDLGGKKYFSVAVLPNADAATLTRFQRHAYAFVRHTEASWQFDEPTNTLTTSYRFDTELVEDCSTVRQGALADACAELVREPLVALYRHQWLNTKASFLDGTYASPRGTMKLLATNEFQTQLQVGPVLPVLPAVDSHSRSTLSNLVQRVLDQPELFPRGLGEKPDHDAYWEGKSLGKLANLMHLADQIGEEEMRDVLLQALKNRLEDWFDGQEPRYFYYEGEWRSLVGFPDSYGSATQLNDHHFHYGYFVMAAAAVARFDADWAKRWGPFVDLVIADAANWDRNDTRFPFLRYMDVYAGHSWANGPAQFEEGNNEEASSEDLNFSAATLLWGALRGDSAVRDLGAFLYATQVSAVEQYWFDVDQAVFPKEFKHPTVAMVWGGGGKYDTWFDQDPTMIHGINFLPFTGASLYLGRHPKYVERNFSVLLERSHGEITTWRDYILMFLATGNPALAREHFDRDRYFEPEFGNTMAYTVHWLEALEELGTIDLSVTADVSTFAVFQKDGKRRHVAFNPDGRPRTVHFSDGTKLKVPPRAVVLR